MKLTRHSHYAITLVGLIVANTLMYEIGLPASLEMVAGAVIGLGFIVVLIMWIVFAFSKKQKKDPSTEKKS